MEAADAALESARAEVDPELTALCELRIRRLLGASGPPAEADRSRIRIANAAQVEALSDYATSSLFDERERACLALAEHVCADAASVDDRAIARVKSQLGEDGYIAFIYALTLMEGRTRMELALRELW